MSIHQEASVNLKVVNIYFDQKKWLIYIGVKV